jgi:hypothetical protein
VRRLFALCVFTGAFLAVVPIPSAVAACPSGTEQVKVDGGGTVVRVERVLCVPAIYQQSGNGEDGFTYTFIKMCERSGFGCTKWQECPRVDGKLGNKYYVMAWPLKGGEAIEIGERCYYDGEQITAEMVAKEFAKETPPSVELMVQPPGGRTLVNFDTVYSTQAEAYVKPVRLLGETVELKISPVRYTWNHGDGTDQHTTHPGQEFDGREGVEPSEVEGMVTHQYVALGTYAASVAVEWNAVYRIQGDTDWTPVDGTVTSQGPSVDLEVLEAYAKLVA